MSVASCPSAGSCALADGCAARGTACGTCEPFRMSGSPDAVSSAVHRLSSSGWQVHGGPVLVDDLWLVQVQRPSS